MLTASENVCDRVLETSKPVRVSRSQSTYRGGWKFGEG